MYDQADVGESRYIFKKREMSRQTWVKAGTLLRRWVKVGTLLRREICPDSCR